jgi:hypothetical protein
MTGWFVYVIYLFYHVIATLLEAFIERTRYNGYTSLTFRFRRESRRQTAETLRPRPRSKKKRRG